MCKSLIKLVVVCGFVGWGHLSVKAQELPFTRGDVNQDGRKDISDAIAGLRHLFDDTVSASCEKAVDANDDGALDIADVVYIVQYLFAGGSEPPPPFTICGLDPTADDLSCDDSWCGAQPPGLLLRDDCEGTSDTEYVWEVTNQDAWAVMLDWALDGTDQSGTVELPALGTEPIITTRVPGVNTLILYLRGEEVARHARATATISEVMASNAESLEDEDGDSSDWIEIRVAPNICLPSIDLTGWYLTDNPDVLTKWQIPAVTLDPGDYLVVFASGKDRAEEGSELHTNFKLDAQGEYVALVAADGVTVVDEFADGYPEQLTDVSYGSSQWQSPLIEARARAFYHIPTAADANEGDSWADPDFVPSGWHTGSLGLGCTSVNTDGFEVTYIKAATTWFWRVTSIARAREVLTNSERQDQIVTGTAQFIDFFSTGESGNFSNDNPFPGIGGGDVNDFVVHITGTVSIPQPGLWSFGVNSDDGFSLTLTDGEQTFTMEYSGTRGAADTIQPFDIARAGQFEVDLLYFERSGGAELEFFAAQGNHSTFSYDHFRLVGDTSHGGLATLGFGSEIATNVRSRMVDVNASLWARIPFTVDAADALGSLLLRMKYEDGFVAYLNGREVARRNAPATLDWNSQATADRAIEDVPMAEEIDLTSAVNLLTDGENVLAVHGLNDATSDGDFLIMPELIGFGRDLQVGYMPTPTPGSFNIPGLADYVRPVTCDMERGFYETPFSLVLETATPDAEIRYTLDGSSPTSTTGTAYAGPLTIGRTTVLRTCAFKEGYLDARVSTRSYFFVDDILMQSPNSQAPGPGWPTGSVNGQILNYGMDPDIVNHVTWGRQLRDALLDIPTISLATDLENLFGSTTGIFVNARSDGRAWERRTSVEMIHPDGSEGFGVDAGLRIRGAFSRSGANPKHAFRLIFRNTYGVGTLDYPLFGGEGVDTFDKIDLRTSQNYSWAFEGSTQNTMLRDVFSRDVQRDMGQPYTRSRYYHLYLNGHYWGIYQTQERADADFAESYLGGDEDDYDVIKNDSSGSRDLQATDGTIDPYERLYNAAVDGFSSDAAYLGIQGLMPDGSVDPGGEQLVYPENLMDYMICTYYTGDPDAPVSCWAHFSNNVFAIYNRARKDGFVWFRHDAEHSLGANGGLNEGRLLTDGTDRSIGQEWRHFNPAWLHLRLTVNDEYSLHFADRVTRYLFNGGILTSTPNVARWNDRVRQIELAIIAESARWGDSKTNPPRTKTDWLNQVNYMVNSYFPQRTQIVVNQMRSVGMFPQLGVVSFNQHGGAVDPGFEVSMSQFNGTHGTIYYTVDGSDPRLWGGAVNLQAAVFEEGLSVVALNETTTVKARLYNGSQWGAMTEARFTIGLEGLVINEFMASNHQTLEDPDEPGEFPDWVELYNGTSETISLGGMYLSDDLQDLTKWQIHETVYIDPGEHLIFFADDDGTQGVFHTSYKLSVSGETIALVDSDGTTILDSIVFEAQIDDVSSGRFPDGSDTWGFHQIATPGGPNQEHTP